MRKKLIIFGLLLFGVYLLLQTNLIPWKSSHSWHVRGRVFDKTTNALAGVSIVGDGTVRWTLINLFFGTGPRTFRAQTTTTMDGGFAFDCKASSFTLAFIKNGYAEKRLFFTHLDHVPVVREIPSGDEQAKTDQDVQVFLDHAETTPKTESSERKQ